MNYHIVTPFYRYENEDFLKENTKGFIWHKIEGIVDAKDQTYGKINQFIAEHEIIDDDYYQILMDDDALPDGFFDAQKYYNQDIVVFSMLRGHQIPPGTEAFRAHPTDTLIACRDNMKVGSVGLQQIRFKGSIFKTLHCEDVYYADGLVAESIRDREIKYVPDIFILFNYLEPGRWNQRPSESK